MLNAVLEAQAVWTILDQFHPAPNVDGQADRDLDWAYQVDYEVQVNPDHVSSGYLL